MRGKGQRVGSKGAECGMKKVKRERGGRSIYKGGRSIYKGGRSIYKAVD